MIIWTKIEHMVITTTHKIYLIQKVVDNLCIATSISPHFLLMYLTLTCHGVLFFSSSNVHWQEFAACPFTQSEFFIFIQKYIITNR